MPNTARDAPRQAFGPTTNGRATNPAHPARPPGPHLARDAAEPSRPLDLIRRPAATLAGSKPETPVFPETLAALSPSPFSLHAMQRWLSGRRRETRGRRRRRPPRRRARSTRARARRCRAAWRRCLEPSRARSCPRRPERRVAACCGAPPPARGGAHPSRTSTAMGDA